MSMKTRRELSESELQDAIRLKEIWNRRKIELKTAGVKLTQEYASEELGFGTQGAVSQYLNANIPLNISVILKFAKLLDCEASDIRPQLKTLIATEVIGNTQEINPNNSDNKGVPLISFVSAGHFCEAIDSFDIGHADEWYPCPSRHSKHTYALRVDGDSMTSTHARSYPHGTIIYVDPEVQPTNGCNVIAKRTSVNEATFKQYKVDSGSYYLIPLNPQYPTVEIDSTTRICGVIIGSYFPE